MIYRFWRRARFGLFVLAALFAWELDTWAGVNSATIESLTPSAAWFRGTDLPTAVAVTYNWSGTNITGAALAIGAPPPPLGSPMAVQNISFTANSGTRTDKVPVPAGLPDGKLTIYVLIFSSTAPSNLSAQQSQAVWIDKTPPTISATRSPSPNAAGWNNSDVIISFVCSDGADGSGVSNCPGPVTLTGEGANQSAVVLANDQAGNTRVLTIDGINIDKTPPRLRLNSPVTGTTYAIGQKVTADWVVEDDWSGVASVNATAAKGNPIDTGTLGVKEFRLTATDGAGNSASLAVTYKISYDFAFAPPLKPNKVNIFSLGKTIQIKFRLLDGRKRALRGVSATLWYRAEDEKGHPISETYQPAPPKAPFDSETFLFNANSGFYYFNADSVAIGAGRWQLEVRLDDGSTRTLDIIIKGAQKPTARRPSSLERLRGRQTDDSLSTLHVEGEPDAIAVEIFDAQGRLVLRREGDIDGLQVSLTRNSSLANGIYFCVVTTRDDSRNGIVRSELKKLWVVR